MIKRRWTTVIYYMYVCQGPGGSMNQVVGLPINLYKPITNTAWVRAQLCKLQKRVHSTRSRKWYSLPVACPWSVVLFGYSGFFHHWNWSPCYSWNIAESGVKTPKIKIKSCMSAYYMYFWPLLLRKCVCPLHLKYIVSLNQYMTMPDSTTCTFFVFDTIFHKHRRQDQKSV
jgi:hypothetical protein